MKKFGWELHHQYEEVKDKEELAKKIRQFFYHLSRLKLEALEEYISIWEETK